MRIQAINNIKYQSINKRDIKDSPETIVNSEETLKVGYTDLVFKAGLVLKKPVYESQITEKLAEKIASYIQKIPEASKILQPISFKYDGGVAGFVVDKTKKNETKISVKMFDGKEELGDWNSREGEFTALEMSLNKKGQMTKGMYYSMPCRMNYIFERLPRNARRVKYANAFYMQRKEDNRWTKLVLKSPDYQYASSLENIMDYSESKLHDMFIKLAEKDTVFFNESV